MNIKPFHYYLLFVLGYLLFIFHIPDSGYDKNFLISWSKYIMEFGFSNIYLNPEVNNHPIPLYLLKLFSLFFRSSDEINLVTINYIKAIYIIFDFLSLALLIHILYENSISLHKTWILILNPAFWYNTVIWIQCDTIHTFFVFVSLYTAIKNKPYLSIVSLSLALATKLQAVIFLPFILMIIFSQPSTLLRLTNANCHAELSRSMITNLLLPKIKFKTLVYFVIKILVLVFTVFIIILFPFIINGTFIESIKAIVSRSLDFYPYVSVSAYNVWYFFFSNPMQISDSLTFLGISYKLWGIILFGSSFLFLLILLHLYQKKSYFDFVQRDNKISFQSILFLILSCAAVFFFYFNTQMHERYMHPAILFGGMYAIFSGNYSFYLLISVAYLLNLESVMQIMPYIYKGFSENSYQFFLFNPIFVSILILAALLIGISSVFRIYKK